MGHTAEQKVTNEEYLRQVLADRPLLSSEVIPHLMSLAGLSREAASRAVERAANAGQIFSSKPVSLAEGRDYLYWLPRTTGSQDYFVAVMARVKLRPSFNCVIRALDGSSGWLPEGYLGRVTPAPHEPRFGTPTVSKILWDLIRLKIIQIQPSERYGQIFQLTPDFIKVFPPDQAPLPHDLLLRSEGLLLKVIAQWLQHSSMAAWNSVEVRNSTTGRPVLLNGFGFDLKAPTYIRPIARQADKAVPGFIVADVSLAEFREFEAKSFLRKLDFVRHRRNAPAVLGMCFAERFDQKAFDALRKAGVMVVPLAQIGSRSLPELIRFIAGIFESVQREGARDIAAALKSVEQLAGERESNMAGSILELMIGRSLEQQGERVLFFDKRIRGVLPSGKAAEREIDVVSDRGERIRFSEVKGYHRFQPVELQEVRRYFEETAPLARDTLLNGQNYRTAVFSFFTSSYFKRDAHDYLVSLKAKYRDSNKIRIEFMDGETLKATWDDLGIGDLSRLLKRYFGTNRKMVYDPDSERVVETPEPQFEHFISTAPEPREADAYSIELIDNEPHLGPSSNRGDQQHIPAA